MTRRKPELEPIPHFRTLPSLFRAMSKCTRCELAAGRTQVVPGVGNRDADLMFIGEAPGANEDLSGQPFVGRGGALLDKVLLAARIDRGDVFITNIVACRPPANRTPKASEVCAHAPWIEQQIRLVAPRLIVTLGRTALTYFIAKAKVGELRGHVQKIAYREGEVTILPTLHPAAVLRDPELRPGFEADFKTIAKLLRRLS